MSETMTEALRWVDKEKSYRHIIFAAAMLIVPTFGVFVVMAGVVPAATYVLLLVSPVFFLAAPHLAIYGGILYFLSSVLSDIIMRLPKRPFRFLALGLLLVGFFYLSLMEVYYPMSHSSNNTAKNLYGLLAD